MNEQEFAAGVAAHLGGGAGLSAIDWKKLLDMILAIDPEKLKKLIEFIPILIAIFTKDAPNPNP